MQFRATFHKLNCQAKYFPVKISSASFYTLIPASTDAILIINRYFTSVYYLV